MIAGEVNNFWAFGQQAGDVFDDLHVRHGPVALVELPHIDDVAIQDNGFRSDGFEIAKKLFRVAAVSTQMNIRKY